MGMPAHIFGPDIPAVKQEHIPAVVQPEIPGIRKGRASHARAGSLFFRISFFLSRNPCASCCQACRRFCHIISGIIKQRRARKPALYPQGPRHGPDSRKKLPRIREKPGRALHGADPQHALKHNPVIHHAPFKMHAVRQHLLFHLSQKQREEFPVNIRLPKINAAD